ncbi:glutamate racemase [Rhodococcus sp. PAMC28707]|uniref:glutamate racemase n=1 Tax=unclassified Rhodococcus (in: high G+C Gram-positive bacteria) TaxID=192944 RepID=UPI00109DB9A9|nr:MULTISPECIES: aspartate/glutamate racemase family protein [unclassified Rhodococcus (in: high G+C Gram-positive bacteria)]QCB50454.1 glutamate racemase [Rhodococcus sp. PAMC28705]QCB57854.1 glutamate racemase [Rhodococcus sp. PAMC28707]
MMVGLIDSGLGLLPTAARLRELRPDLDLILLMDPDGAPWGPKPDGWVIDRVVNAADRAVSSGAEVIVLPCNTASVTALAHVRRHLGDAIPVIGTVPAIKPAAAASDRIAVWATAATTASAYQARLIEEFATGRSVTSVACHGLADSIDRGDAAAISAAIRIAVAATPADVDAVVLGCTHYPLVSNEITSLLPDNVRLFDSAEAVARQTLRRSDSTGRLSTGSSQLTVFLSDRRGELPVSALAHREGRLLSNQSICK